MRSRELKAIALGMRRGILGTRPSTDMCMAVSAPLQSILSTLYGVETELEEVDFLETNHVWLRLQDGRILDATADQFGLEPVYLGPVPDVYLDLMEEARFSKGNIMQKRDAPLTTQIVDGILTISIGVATLAFAVQQADTWDDMPKVIDTDIFAQDILAALNDEEEDGTTALHVLFDKAAIQAVEDGSLGVAE